MKCITSFRAWAGLLAVFCVCGSAVALVNPNFTVVDLKDASSSVLVLRVSVPSKGKMTAEVIEKLTGKEKLPEKFVLDIDDAEVSVDDVTKQFRRKSSAVGMMFIRKQKDQYGDTVASLQIGTEWMGLIKIEDGKWDVVRDPDDLETVWAGSATQLRRGINHLLTSRSAEFPVSSGLTWAESKQLATLKGSVNGSLVTTDGVIVLCDSGDRIYAPGKGGPTDVTDKLKLTSRSKKMTVGDFNADGKMDLASWDGGKLRLILRKADGTFTTASAGVEFKDVSSLHALGRHIIATTPKGCFIFTPDAQGTLAGTPITLCETSGGPKRGKAGGAALADLNNDGLPDLVHAYEKGLVIHAGIKGDRPSGSFGRVDVVKEPRDVLCGDFDTDGQMDVMVAGEGGVNLLTRNADGTWTSSTYETGELAAAVGSEQTQSSVDSLSAVDLNGDGRESVAAFSSEAAPGIFYSRGFNCFAIAIELTRAEDSPKGYDALSHGQQTGVWTDLNGDLSPDLLGVDAKGNVWALTTEPDSPRRFAITVNGPADGPVTVDFSLNKDSLGSRILQPGRPTTVVLPRAGRLTLTWKTREGKTATRNVVVTRHVRLDALTPEGS
ncbi:MAG: FG-GAP repeat domain-containing protein [Phycisphaerae bacterium]